MGLKEIEEKYNITALTVKGHIKRGTPSAKKISQKWEIDENHFKEWLEKYNNGYYNKQHWDRKIFNVIDTPEKAYWLGFINADGCIHEKARYVSLNIGGRDRRHLEKFVDFLGADRKMIKTCYHRDTGNELVYIALCSVQLMSDLERLGIFPNKSGKEHFINTDYDVDFIRGLIDGDGSIHSDLKGIDLVGSYELLSAVQQKFYSYLQIQPHKIHEHGTIFRIYYKAREDVYKIVKFLYRNSSVSLDRKQELANKIIQNYEKIC